MEQKLYSLGGLWKIVKDEENNGRAKGWAEKMPELTLSEIRIPGTVKQDEVPYLQVPYSSVFPGYHGYVWYYRTFEAENLPGAGERARIEFDDAGHVAEVFLNGVFLGRHEQHEDPFSYDITDVLKAGENLVAVRCFEPAPMHEPIDGYTLREIPNGIRGFANYESDHAGGILGEVRLVIVPTVRVAEAYLRPMAKTGEVQCEITLENVGEEKTLQLSVSTAEMKTGLPAAFKELSVTAPKGISVQKFSFTVPGHKLWEMDCPVLYICSIALDGAQQKTVRIGFRELEMRHGFFFLNGKRFFLKCTHFNMQTFSVIGIKAMGFNSVRCLTHVAEPELLDLCDELGLLVIESPLSSWGMIDHAKTKEMIFSCMDRMILRDRNHPCIMGWYVFNELGMFGAPHRIDPDRDYTEVDVFWAGVDYIHRLRELDMDRAVLLSSGRWDNQIMVGSVSAPGDKDWSYQWGAEGDPDYVRKPHGRNTTNTFTDLDGMGDIHPYARMPMDRETRNWFRALGHDTAPVFISEMGNGSHMNPIRDKLDAEEAGVSRESIYYKANVRQAEALEEFLADNGFDRLFPFAESFVEETYRMNERQREEVFDVIRANPMFCGYSLTSWGTSNEGTLEGKLVLKPGTAYALQTGWAPLRWAIFPEERTVYADKPFKLEAVLCNEDALAPGDYAAEIRIHGKQGHAWKQPFTASYPAEGYGDMPPLAAKVLDETVTLPAGDYTVQAKLLEKAGPYGGKIPLKAVKLCGCGVNGKKAAVWGLSEEAKALLKEYGAELTDIADADTDAKLLLIGAVQNMAEYWEKTCAIAENGGTVVFVSADPLCGVAKESGTQMSDMPTARFAMEREDVNPYLTAIAGDMARCATNHDWLYHRDTVIIDHPMFKNVAPAGIIDMETWGDVCPARMFVDMRKPDAVLSASIAIRCQVEGDIARSQALCEYSRGEGRFVVNGFKVCENIGRHPFADQLLLNFVSVYGE